MTATRTKPARFARLLAVVAPLGERLVELEERRPRSTKSTSYYVRRLAADYGTAFLWTKYATQGGESYAVNVSDEGDTCECLGHLRHGHETPCRHVAATRALLAAGKLS